MAKTKLSTAAYVTRGYCQVEPNHLSAQRTAQIYAQLPLADTLTKVENGQFVKYDYANKEVNLTGDGEWMLVFNEVKLYGEREQYEDFVFDNTVSSAHGVVNMTAVSTTINGNPVPRVFKTNVGDIFTTNAIQAAAGSLEDGDKLAVGADGFLAPTEATEGMIWQVAKVYTLADNQPAVKIIRIQ
jgi:hypothetical protein